MTLNPLQKSIFGLLRYILATSHSPLIAVIILLRLFELRAFRLKSNLKYSKETFAMGSVHLLERLHLIAKLGVNRYSNNNEYCRRHTPH